jgi:hypothetical protein
LDVVFAVLDVLIEDLHDHVAVFFVVIGLVEKPISFGIIKRDIVIVRMFVKVKDLIKGFIFVE